jgi:hypothetical protein
MTVRFHKFVQRDVNYILKHYYSISDELAEGFWREFNLYFSCHKQFTGSISRINDSIQSKLFMLILNSLM